MIISKKLAFALLTSVVLSLNFAIAQDKGDEDKAMYNNGKERDELEIKAAKSGWWTESMKTHEERIKWWREAKFGMFIHWGIYSLPGGEWKGNKVTGYSEHLMRKEKIPRTEYLELAHQFNPTDFNADTWVKAAKNAGMNYLIITAKHHDGFAMYDSKVSDYNIVKQTKWKHDPMVDLSAACKKYGVKFGFYYSHAYDWEHPDAPGNDWDYNNPGGDRQLYGGKNWFDQHPELLPKAQQYVNNKAIPQIKELLVKYHPDILWFDTPQKLPLSENIRILKAIRETDPNVVVNGRLARGARLLMGDYINTGDRPAEFFPTEEGADWEAIPTTNESYGFSKYDSSHKPVKFFVQLLAKAASRGGNLLMNVGPRGDGKMDEKDLVILSGLGKWIDKNKEGIYSTKPTGLPLQSFGVTTLKDNKLYLHAFNWPNDGKLIVSGLKKELISSAYLLTDAKKKALSIEAEEWDVKINVPSTMPDTLNTVIVLELKNKLVPSTSSKSQVVSNMNNRLLAFDAKLVGKGFTHGDGKTGNYFVEGWKTMDQSIGWAMRVNKDMKCKVVVKYVASPAVGGIYKLSLGNTDFVDTTIQMGKKETIITKELGVATLKRGDVSIIIKAIDISQKELMKLLEIDLIPVNE